MEKEKICACGKQSIPGLIMSVSLCQKHYDYLMFSNQYTEEHKEGILMLKYGGQGIKQNDMRLIK